MSTSRLELADLDTGLVPEAVPYAVLLPPGYGEGEAMPLCLMLHGGGGNRDMLVGFKATFDAWWADGSVPPMVVATASTGELSFYLDHPDGRTRWETFVAEAFPAHLRERYAVGGDAASTVITGVSMGGCGSLKVAFARPDAFAAVAALEPAVEPGYRSADSTARSRIYSMLADDLPELLGPERDAALFEANHPPARLRANADAVRKSGLAIYLECGDDDALNLHDGTEFLHRVLWDLDISHEYHLVRGADHVGPSLVPRLHRAMTWLGQALEGRREVGDVPLTAADRAWMAWAEGGFEGEAPQFDLNTESAVRMLRAQFAPAREEAEKTDPTAKRRYAVMPASR